MSRSTRSGLSLMEVVIALAILIVAVCLFFPATRRVRDASSRAVCQSNLRQLAIALHAYHGDQQPATYPSTGIPNGPPEQFFPTGCLGPGTVPEERLSWMVSLLPYLDQGQLYQQFDRDRGIVGNTQVASTKIKVFRCPGGIVEPEIAAFTNYVAMSGIGRDAANQPAGTAGNGFMGYDRRTSLDSLKDGSAWTIALMETHLDIGPWARGGPSTLRGFDAADLKRHENQKPFSGHYNLIVAVMADASTRSISTRIDPKKLEAAITIAGGESLDLD